MYGSQYEYAESRISKLLKFNSWEERCNEEPHYKKQTEDVQDAEDIQDEKYEVSNSNYQDKLDVLIDLQREILNELKLIHDIWE